ncbi:hypothetical protein HY214_01690 [Candidatus Roizmanbacteria bacterium]|nr:hypothetical protein [Candidatus Roizmanbacteria bacterium]
MEITIFRTPDSFGTGTLLGNNPEIYLLPPMERLLVSAWRHACVRPDEVSKGLGSEWTRQRYDDCNFVFKSVICAQAEAKPELYKLLTSPTPRLPDEPVGVYEPGAVPESHIIEMSPLSTLWGYALPRVFIEHAGRDEERTAERYFHAIDLLGKAITMSSTPIELLANLAELVVCGDANPSAVLSHVLEPGVLVEENNRTMYREVIATLKKNAPSVWRHYLGLTEEEREQAGILKNPEV